MNIPEFAQRFFVQADERPEQIAVIDRSREITYSELASLVRRIAATLLNMADQPRVLITLPQSIEAYALMMGTVVSGGLYCPVNYNVPEQRKWLIAQQFKPDVIAGELNSYTNLDLLEIKRFDFGQLSSDQLTASSYSDLAYIIFTSGSTGVPKGVKISKIAVDKFISWSREATEATTEDRWAQFSNIGFDLSVMDIFTALSSGATLVAIDSTQDRLFPARAIKRHQITIWHSVPSIVELMQKTGQLTADHLASIRLMSFCGEPLYTDYLEWLFVANPSMRVFNTYGPTEGTVFCMWLELARDTFRDICKHTAPLGKAISGWNVMLGGEKESSEGEIFIYGNYIGKGYLDHPEQAETGFGSIKVEGINVPCFRTGDWAIKNNGHLYFSHRIDRQVKVHGFRVELGEVDHFARQYGFEVVHSIEHRGRIYTFVQASSVEQRAVRTYLANLLPHYSVPERIIPLENFPRNANDKIDVEALTKLIGDE